MLITQNNSGFAAAASTGKGPNLGGLLVAFVVFLTSLTSVVLGIVAAYGVVNAILNVFAYQSRERLQRSPVLIPSQTGASGD
jgi:hypothetical protein